MSVKQFENDYLVKRVGKRESGEDSLGGQLVYRVQEAIYPSYPFLARRL